MNGISCLFFAWTLAVVSFFSWFPCFNNAEICDVIISREREVEYTLKYNQGNNEKHEKHEKAWKGYFPFWEKGDRFGVFPEIFLILAEHGYSLNKGRTKGIIALENRMRTTNLQ